jgi:AcrR family transcriptional regulator
MVLYSTDATAYLRRRRGPHVVVKLAKTLSDGAPNAGADKSARERVLNAAFSAFMEHGFEGASTLEVATRAKVSKRELYALFENKQAMLAACINERAKRMRLALKLPPPHDRRSIEKTLVLFGTAILLGVSNASVLAVFRLAISESKHSPEVARVLDENGRKANHAALAQFLALAQAKKLIGPGKPETIATSFFALLWGDLLVRQLLGVTKAPTEAEAEERARLAMDHLLLLYPQPRHRSGSK